MKNMNIFCAIGGLLIGMTIVFDSFSKVPQPVERFQEMTILGGQFEFIDSDCQSGTGGCTAYESRPTIISCPAGTKIGQDCGQSRWSTDTTGNRVCSTDGDWTFLPGAVCSPIDPHKCIDTFTTCNLNHTCSGTSTEPGQNEATDCQW